MFAIQSDLATYHCLYIKGAVAFQMRVRDKMGNVGCWKIVDVELINQHSLYHGEHTEQLYLEEYSAQRFWQNFQ